MKTALLSCLLCLSFTTQAQSVIATPDSKPFARKTWLLGLQGGYSKANFLANNLTAQLYGGYFVTNKLLLGLSGTGLAEWTNTIVHDNMLAIGPQIRYQLTQTRFSPFLAASYQFGRYTYSSIEATTSVTNGSTVAGMSIAQGHAALTVHSRSFTAGLSIGITRTLRADIGLKWQDIIRPSEVVKVGSNSLWQPQLGVSYTIVSGK